MCLLFCHAPMHCNKKEPNENLKQTYHSAATDSNRPEVNGLYAKIKIAGDVRKVDIGLA